MQVGAGGVLAGAGEPAPHIRPAFFRAGSDVELLLPRGYEVSAPTREEPNLHPLV